jgi:hypothetical protein
MIPRMLKTPLAALAVAGLLLAGCGGERTDVTAGVDELNVELKKQDAELDCPKEVDGGEGTSFDCTLRSTSSKAEAPVTLKIVKEGEDLAVDLADQKQFESAVRKVVRR